MRRLLVVAALLAACSSNDANAPHPGRLDVILHGAGAASIGAVVFVVSGGSIDAVTSAPGDELGSITDATGTHVVLTGAIVDGAIATIAVPDVSRAAAYVVTIEQVANGATFGLVDPAPLSMTVVPRQ
ncbi:MAG: hypothetical protein ACREL5_01525 [Gemmatimonadales bacterium]